MAHDEVEFQSFAAHFPPVCSEMDEYVTDVVLKNSRYLFVTRKKNLQYGYCTHCKKTYRTEGLRQAYEIYCKNCNSKVVVKMAGVSRKYLTDNGHVVFYEKSAIDANAIVARGYYVTRDYRENYEKVETKYTPTSMYLFRMSGSVMYERHYDYSQNARKWRKAAKVTKDYASGLTYCPIDWIERAVQGTPFQYSTWEQHFDSDGTKFFDLYSIYPCIEYLTKLNMKYYVSAKMYDGLTYGAINWKGTSIDKVLKLNKQRAKQFIDWVQKKDYPAALTLRLFQKAIKENSTLSLDELNVVAHDVSRTWKLFSQMLKYLSIHRANSYIEKQRDIERAKKRPYGHYDVLRTWKDYINDCKLLEFDLSQELILFPSNLYRAHQNTISQIKIKEDIELNEKMEARLKELKKFYFEKDGLFIRAASNQQELIQEGKTLHHCVGGYAKKYIEGKCDILVIRKTNAPDTPFFTVELVNKQVVQCRGLRNCGMSDEIEKFIEAFKLEKLSVRKKRKSNKTSIMQEVAV